MVNKDSLIFVAGHKGLVGSSVIRRLNFFGYKNIITRTRNQLDLRNQIKGNVTTLSNSLYGEKLSPEFSLIAEEVKI